MDMDTVKKASRVYFYLLEKIVISNEDQHFDLYYEENVRDAVKMIADQAKTRIVEAETRLHLVTKADGSIFATNFTHLKEKYKEIENKKYYHLTMVILMTYIAEIDRNKAAKLAAKRDGITFYFIANAVDRLVDSWNRKLKNDPEFSSGKGIAMQEIVDLWTNLEVVSERDHSHGRPNIRTRIGTVTAAMKLLRDERLVYIADTDNVAKVFPRPELFERVEYLYHSQERYQELKEIIEQESDNNA